MKEKKTIRGSPSGNPRVEKFKSKTEMIGSEKNYLYRKELTMNNKTQDLQGLKYYSPAIKKMRLILVMLAILYTYGTYSGLGDINTVIFGFSLPALYIISGYVVLRESEDTEKRILRTIGRTAICFLVMFALCFALSLLVNTSGTLHLVASRSFWLNFLVLNICTLPIGSTIWFVQGLLYGYIIVYVIYKLRLLKFDIFFAALCLVAATLAGELAAVVGFTPLGRAYIGGNFLTRALPYILIGRFIQRKEESIYDKLDLLKHIVLLAVGIILTAGEYLALTVTGNKVYVDHLLGMGIIAVAVCLFCFFDGEMRIRFVLLGNLTRHEMMIPFYVCSPIYYLSVTLIILNESLIHYLGGFVGMITLVLSIAALYLYAFARFAVNFIIHRNDEAPDGKFHKKNDV